MGKKKVKKSPVRTGNTGEPDCEGCEQKLSQQQEELKARQAALDTRTQELEALKADLEDQKAEVMQKLREYEHLSRQVADEKEVLLREKTRAQEGFASEQKVILDHLHQQLDALAKDRANLEARVLKISAEAASMVEQQVESAGRAKLEALEKEMQTARDLHEQALNQVMQAVEKLGHTAFENARKTIDDFVDKSLAEMENRLRQKFSVLEEREQVLEKREQQASRLRQQADLDMEKARETIRWHEEEMEREKARLQDEFGQEIQTLKEKNQDLMDQVLQMEDEIDRIRHQHVMIDGRSAEEVAAELKELKKENRKLKKRMESMLPRDEAERLQGMEQGYEAAKLEIAQLKNERDKLYQSVSDLESAELRIEALQTREKTYKRTIEGMRQELEHMKSLWEKPQELKDRMQALIKAPDSMGHQVKECNEDDETQWLSRVKEGIRGVGFEFPERLINAYHTSLKIAEYAPMVVLAGPSGTGKSALGQLYAHFGGLYWQSVQVKPDWDSPQALFGYFHPIDNKFNATTLARAMYQLNNNDDLKNMMLLVLLDEMNLAHVEQYFADPLSLMEERRLKAGDVFVELDMGAGVKKGKLVLSENILWTGTINVDESTLALSDKVIDRANWIYFPSPETFVDSPVRAVAGQMEHAMSFLTWSQWVRKPENEMMEFLQEYRTRIEEINRLMKDAGRAVGHRVWAAMQAYMVNYPGVWQAWQAYKAVKGQENQENEQNSREKVLTGLLDLAFEDQLVQRLFPKLKGLEVKGRIGDILGEIKEKIIGFSAGADFERAMQNPYGIFMVVSADYLKDRE